MSPPKYDLVIEPFAGGAGYSLRWQPRKVILVERNPIVASLWRYLIAVRSEEIQSLPIYFDHIDDLKICQEAKYLIGFWISCGGSAPKKRRSKWARDHIQTIPGSVWSERTRDRIALQCNLIRHWQIIEGDYTSAPDVEAHWIIDPPYQVAGVNYPCHEVNYQELAAWSMARTGYVVVHENEGASWLPFKKFMDLKSMNGKHRTGISREVIWER